MDVATEASPAATLAVEPPPSLPVTKVIVAVHGIGDQQSYATIQAVVNQFCGYYHHPAAIPLGNFHTGQAAFSVQPPYPPDPFNRFAFAEVYWAGIPRSLVEEKHTVEEAKKWARTIVERLQLRRRLENPQGDGREADFRLINQVLVEMIDTIAVLDRLCYLADKAGVFKFDLRKLLEDYLGDVQIVTEFGKERADILEKFDAVMDGVHAEFPDAEIYVVAHSEGTVVSFLGLIRAFREETLPRWAERVRGFMTLGSPIDKHLVLWPELFDRSPPASLPSAPIEWRNYYDYGDPVGFALDEARGWLDQCGWKRVFNFTDAPGHDNGFARYPFPGKAHVDYWTDRAVFGHFIETVVGERPPEPAGKPAESFGSPPASIRWNQWISYLVPYAGVAALLCVAAYVLFKAVTAAVDPKHADTMSVGTIARSVMGLGALLFGTTVMARVPRLTLSVGWRVSGIAVGLLSIGAYLWSVWGGERRPLLLGVWASHGEITAAVAVVLGIAVLVLSTIKASWGLRPMIVLGGLAVAGIVAYHLSVAKQAGEIGPLWPVLIATAAFLYLWWLAALLFDLVFVWHVYIRHAKVLQRLNEMIGARKTGATP
ncbi:MAG: MFS transporter [Gemmatimonadetes bacterium]|nr:MFS transporter [Gemmatimonadota bacterium]